MFLVFELPHALFIFISFEGSFYMILNRKKVASSQNDDVLVIGVIVLV